MCFHDFETKQFFHQTKYVFWSYFFLIVDRFSPESVSFYEGVTTKDLESIIIVKRLNYEHLLLAAI